MPDDAAPDPLESQEQQDLPLRTDAAASAELEALARLRRGRPSRRRSRPEEDAFGSGRDPVPVGELVDGLLRAEGWTGAAQLGDLVAQWGQVAGPDVAGHCRPVGFQDDTLVVQADSSAWAANVRLFLPQLLSRVEARAPGLVKRIEVKGPTGPARSKGRWSVGGHRR
jgi:predicted nucleic acid-binding Zn ribbon protein